MKNSETGEFELVLGNKQLLSGFFIVVILFGVFFTMGYIVGRNSSPSPRMAGVADSVAAAPLPSPVSAVPQQTAAAAPAAVADPAKPAEPPPQTRQAHPLRNLSPPRPRRKREPAKTALAEPAPAAPAKTINEPAPGDTYLQVMAVKRPEAEVVAQNAARQRLQDACSGPVQTSWCACWWAPSPTPRRWARPRRAWRMQASIPS